VGQRRAPRVFGRALTRVRGSADALIAVLLAPACAACARPLAAPLDGPVCPACWNGVDPGGRHEGSLRDIVHAFKYDGRRTLAPRLAALVRARDGHLLRGADCIVPVPLHAARNMWRGFNQAADLAAHLGPPVVHALWRTRYTPPQTALSRVARRRNVRHAFRLSPLLRRERIVGKVVVLVDDVRTTGATLAACARVLKQAGAREVRMLTVAHAPGTTR
jgi:ComF family protein